ncbi:MAG: hypothetical protein KJ624_04920 [Chloroflexi bacterium]|nr:hypothetical protein [Chloroflexota bacterium]
MPRPLPWIRLWLDSLHNLKLLTLTLAEQGAWWRLLMLAGELDAGGALTAGGQPLTLQQVARAVHLEAPDLPVLESMVTKLTSLGTLAWNGATLYIVNYEEREAVAPSDRPEAVRERVRRYRERARERQRQALPPNTPHPQEAEAEAEAESNRYTPLQIYERADEARKLWKKVLPSLRRQVTKANFATWLQNTKALGYDPDGLLVVDVETRAQEENLNRSLYSLARRTLMEVTGAPADIQFVCLKGQGPAKEVYESTPHRDRTPARARRH